VLEDSHVPIHHPREIESLDREPTDAGALKALDPLERRGE
jgi:hypothetical protein